jgi:sulfur-carrier protein
MITLLYFARLKEALGTSREQIPLPGGALDLDGLRGLLVARGGVWAQEFSGPRAIRAAVNQDMARAETPVKDGDEVAFFPPVTGG